MNEKQLHFKNARTRTCPGKWEFIPNLGSTSCLKHKNVPHNIGTMFSRECEINSYVNWLRNFLIKLNGETNMY